MNRSLGTRCLAEGVGTALLVGVGTGSIVAAARLGGVAQVWLAVAWFVAVAVPVLLFAFVSGSHLNPAISLAFVLTGDLPRRELPPYVVAQIAGAFVGSALVFAFLGGASHLGATLPKDGNIALIFPLEFPFTLLLIGSALYLASLGPRVPRGALLLPPLVVAISTFLIGPWTGSSLNPARTLSPAVLSASYAGILLYFGATLSAAVVGAAIWAALRR